ncbi:Biotin/lipoyl attachment protein [compost metagenome]
MTNGETVSKGDLLAVMEAMKMETQIVATKAGKVRLIVKEGDYLQAGAALLEIAE